MNIITDYKIVINLPKRFDRKNNILSQFTRLGFSNYHILNAVDGEKQYYIGRLKKGQNACKLSHINCIKIAKELKLPYIIIFEDDAVFCEGFNENFNEYIKQVPENWQMLYFGAHNYKRLNMISGNVGKCNISLSTVGYAVKENVYDLIIELLKKDEILDVIYTNYLQPKINAYCFYPNLVTQKDGLSDIEGGFVSYKKYYDKWL